MRKAIDEMKGALPPDVNLIITSDDADYISGAIHEVLLTLIIATIIVIGIIYLFLQSVRVTFIPAVTVPIALIGTLAAMWVVGFSINVLTLLALVLATGLVVDDAIVVIENISRQRSLGLGPRAAAVLGTRQVFFAVLATTATLAAVFIPISFFPGLTGSLFSEFGFVLAFAVTLSCFVALTLVADACLAAASATGKPSTSHNAIGRARRGFRRAHHPRLCAPARCRAERADGGHRRGPALRRCGRRRLQPAALRIDAERGSRLHSDLRLGAAGLDGRLHRGADAAGRDRPRSRSSRAARPPTSSPSPVATAMAASCS